MTPVFLGSLDSATLTTCERIIGGFGTYQLRIGRRADPTASYTLDVETTTDPASMRWDYAMPQPGPDSSTELTRSVVESAGRTIHVGRRAHPVAGLDNFAIWHESAATIAIIHTTQRLELEQVEAIATSIAPIEKSEFVSRCLDGGITPPILVGSGGASDGRLYRVQRGVLTTGSVAMDGLEYEVEVTPMATTSGASDERVTPMDDGGNLSGLVQDEMRNQFRVLVRDAASPHGSVVPDGRRIRALLAHLRLATPAESRMLLG